MSEESDVGQYSRDFQLIIEQMEEAPNLYSAEATGKVLRVHTLHQAENGNMSICHPPRHDFSSKTQQGQLHCRKQ